MIIMIMIHDDNDIVIFLIINNDNEHNYHDDTQGDEHPFMQAIFDPWGRIGFIEMFFEYLPRVNKNSQQSIGKPYGRCWMFLYLMDMDVIPI